MDHRILAHGLEEWANVSTDVSAHAFSIHAFLVGIVGRETDFEKLKAAMQAACEVVWQEVAWVTADHEERGVEHRRLLARREALKEACAEVLE